MKPNAFDVGIAVLGLVFGAVALGFWIPTDTETGLLVEDRYSTQVGDALAPTLVAIGITLISALLLLSSVTSSGTRAPAATEVQPGAHLSSANLNFIVVLLAIIAVSLALMYFAGPLIVDGLRSAGAKLGTYRSLIKTPPYNYIGFALGGIVLVASLIAWIEGRPSLRAVLVGIAAVAALIALYDLPFNTLLLPPNGDQ